MAEVSFLRHPGGVHGARQDTVWYTFATVDGQRRPRSRNHKQIYADCRAEWEDDLAVKQHKSTPPSLGYDPGMFSRPSTTRRPVS